MPRPKTITDREVLAAARAVFMEHGAQASTQLVAKRVGLAQPTLFQRFGDKASLFMAALALDPIEPDRIVGDPDEPDRLGREEHMNALVLRLFDELVTVVSVTEVMAAGPKLSPEAVRRFHDEPKIATLVAGLIDHLKKLGISQPWHVEALLLMVHGAAFMAVHTSAGEHENIRNMLTRPVTGALTNTSDNITYDK